MINFDNWSIFTFFYPSYNSIIWKMKDKKEDCMSVWVCECVIIVILILFKSCVYPRFEFFLITVDLLWSQVILWKWDQLKRMWVYWPIKSLVESFKAIFWAGSNPNLSRLCAWGGRGCCGCGWWPNQEKRGTGFDGRIDSFHLGKLLKIEKEKNKVHIRDKNKRINKVLIKIVLFDISLFLEII